MIKYTFSFLLLLVAFWGKAKEKILVNTPQHFASYELVGDELIFTIELLTKNTLNLNYNDSAGLDWFLLQLDHNQNGVIDENPAFDLFYTFDSSAVSNLCVGNLINANTLSNCGNFNSNASAQVLLTSTPQNTQNHVVFTLQIPQNEWFLGSHVCTRVALKIHSGNGTVVNYPTTEENYFVAPFYPVQLFPDVDLGSNLSLCEDTILTAPTGYPFFYWSGILTGNEFTINREQFMLDHPSGKIRFVVEDNTCRLSDEIEVSILSEAFCAERFYSFPNVITPNNDGINDYFEPIIADELLSRPDLFLGAELTIYNRWGVLVHKSFNYPFWDTISETGRGATAGTYFYTFKLNNSENTVINGFFSIIN